ncbi:MAG: ABC transporter permease [Clostridiaceae bacterium]|nr:ABC transporter permease [Clostridiaceae bacterium]
MRISTIRYYIKEGFTSIWTNRMMTLASIGIVIACLIIFGMFILFSSNLNYIGDQVKDQWEIKAFVDENVPDGQLDRIRLEIKKIQYVKECILETEEQALENYKKQLGEDSYVLEGFEQFNPLRNSFIIHLSDVQYAEQVVQELKKVNGIVKVNNHRETIEKILKITEFVRMGSFWVMVLLAFIAVFIISNTIKLTVFARRREISIMKYVGATDWFIRWPFIIEGMIIGLIGGILSLAVVCYAYDYIVNLLHHSISFFKIRQLSEVFEGMAIILISFGACIGTLGSLLSIRKYLRV